MKIGIFHSNDKNDDEVQVDIMENDEYAVDWRSKIFYREDYDPDIKNKLLRNESLRKGIIKYNHPLREKWDFLIVILSIYNCIELPMDIAFNWRN